jgi:hypothetical protein
MKENVLLLLLLWQAIAVTYELCLDIEKPRSRFPQISSGFELEKLWNTNTVTVSFINGDCKQRSMVRMVASEWTLYSNIDFIFIDQPYKGNIRVGFDDNSGRWSLMGMDSKDNSIDINTRMSYKGLRGRSMNLANVDRSTILHEFGRKWERFNFSTQLSEILFYFQIKMLWD